ncbi:hypothetical protein NXV13_30285 [Bacteroides ovatus]|nr:hypothetical protein [Bacteroides ovatus]
MKQTQLKGSTMTGKMGGYNFNDPVDLSLGTEFISNPSMVVIGIKLLLVM